MKAMEAIKKLGAECAANRATLNEAGERTVIARVVDGDWQLTEEGEKRAKALEDAPKKPTPKPVETTPPVDE